MAELPEFKLTLETIFNPVPISKIIVNNNVTIVLWKDGTKTRATCSGGDILDPVVGIGQCLLKKTYGKRKIASLVKKVEYQKAKSIPDEGIPF